MIIPRKFQLLGSEWTVKRVKDIEHGDDAVDGLTTPDKRLIEIDSKAFKDRDKVEHVFLHELVHAINYAQGEDELYKNEKYTDLTAGLLHQALTSADGELKEQ